MIEKRTRESYGRRWRRTRHDNGLDHRVRSIDCKREMHSFFLARGFCETTREEEEKKTILDFMITIQQQETAKGKEAFLSICRQQRDRTLHVCVSLMTASSRLSVRSRTDLSSELSLSSLVPVKDIKPVEAIGFVGNRFSRENNRFKCR